MPRFRIERKGDLVLSTMRQHGWPGVGSVTEEKLSRGECTEYEMKWINEIDQVQTCVWGADAEGWHDPLLPPFNVMTAFYFRGGVYAAVRERVEHIQGNPQVIMTGGQKKRIVMPMVEIKPAFFLGLQAKVGPVKARSIMSYIMQVCNDLLVNSHASVSSRSESIYCTGITY